LASLRSWAITRFRFPGRTLLTTLIDLPFAVSPVVAGLMITLLFGRRGYFGPWLLEHGIQILFSWPAIVLATTFVTFPFVARELIPIMDALARTKKRPPSVWEASGWQMFWRVTVPNIKWGLLYGVILCSASRDRRVRGCVCRFGAHRRPDRYGADPHRKAVPGIHNAAAFAVASLLTLLALVTLGIKVLLERKTRQELEESGALKKMKIDLVPSSAWNAPCESSASRMHRDQTLLPLPPTSRLVVFQYRSERGSRASGARRSQAELGNEEGIEK